MAADPADIEDLELVREVERVPVEQMDVDSFPTLDDALVTVDPVSPGSGTPNGFIVHPHPPSEFGHCSGLHLRNRPVSAWPDVNEQISVFSDDIHEVPDEFSATKALVCRLFLVVAKRTSEPPRRLPRFVDFGVNMTVLPSEESVVGYSPAVVDDPLRYLLQVVAEQAGEPVGLTPLARIGPLNVIPQYVRSEPCDKFSELSGAVFGEVGVVAAEGEQLGIGGDRPEVPNMPVERSQ